MLTLCKLETGLSLNSKSPYSSSPEGLRAAWPVPLQHSKSCLVPWYCHRHQQQQPPPPPDYYLPPCANLVFYGHRR